MLQDFYILTKLLREFNLSEQQKQYLVSKRLKKVLCSAYNGTKYYRKLMDDSGYNPNFHYKDPDDLKKLRITTKKDLKENPIEDFINENARTKYIFTDSTSGSTGIPLKVYRNEIERKYQVAKWLRVLFLNGYKPYQKVMSFTSPARLNEGKNIVQNFGLFRRYAIDYLADPHFMVDEMLKYKPDYMYGNRSHFDLIANELIKRNIYPYGLKKIIIGAEVITKFHYHNLKESFKTKILDAYGSVELGSIGFETNERKGLLLNEDLIYFEFLDNFNLQSKAREESRIIATDLINLFMPFIRYEQGDNIVFDFIDGKRHLIQINGRNDDLIYLPNGNKKTFHFFYEIFHHYNKIRQFIVIQTKINEIVVEIDCDLDYLNQIKSEIMNELKKK